MCATTAAQINRGEKIPVPGFGLASCVQLILHTEPEHDYYRTPLLPFVSAMTSIKARVLTDRVIGIFFKRWRLSA